MSWVFFYPTLLQTSTFVPDVVGVFITHTVKKKTMNIYIRYAMGAFFNHALKMKNKNVSNIMN